jgi:hypothetical protein
MAKQQPNISYDSDVAALDEVGQTERDYHVLGVINDEQAFLSVVRSLDAIMGRTHTPTRVDAIINDKQRASYFNTVVILIRESKLTLKELDRVLLKVTSVLTKDKRNPLRNESLLVPFLMKWLRYPDFEPLWHITKRGDNKPLPSSRGKDLWGYLQGLYTDPEKVRLREPDYVRMNKQMYPGYEECIKKARRDAEIEMKRRYGDDVDLSPVTDLPKRQSKTESSFIDMLRQGSFGDLLDDV